MNEDLKRLMEIARTLIECKQQVTRTALRMQFRYETGRDPQDGDVAKIVGRKQ